MGVTSRVILPITDPYVIHHGALGSYAGIHLEDQSPETLNKVMRALRDIPGIYTVMDRNEACRTFDLPPDRTADLVVVGDKHTVLGRTTAFHDLSQVPHLRSHGGLEESTVPLFFNHRLSASYSKRLNRGQARNFHLYDFLLNGVEDSEGASNSV